MREPPGSIALGEDVIEGVVLEVAGTLEKLSLEGKKTLILTAGNKPMVHLSARNVPHGISDHAGNLESVNTLPRHDLDIDGRGES